MMHLTFYALMSCDFLGEAVVRLYNCTASGRAECYSFPRLKADRLPSIQPIGISAKPAHSWPTG